MSKTIIAFGHYDLEGGRSWTIRTGLAERGWSVVLCRTEAKGITDKYRDLYRQWKALAVSPEAVYVPFLGHWILPLAWWLTRRPRVPLVFDAFLSLYDTEVHDRKRVPALHPKSWFLWMTDWLCCRLCDRVLLDTPEHAAYFTRTFGMSPEKLLTVPIGCRTDLFSGHWPVHANGEVFVGRPTTKAFRVVFHGTFIPLQGIDVILQAAKLLQNRREQISFILIGKGQTYPAMRTLATELGLTNVEFRGMVPMATLPELLRGADACLGIFGTTEKAGRVIPNKAYEILAVGAPLVTGRTAAASRVLQDGRDALLTEPGNHEELAAALLHLRDDPALLQTIAEHGRALSLRAFRPHAIVAPLDAWLSARGS